MGSVGGPGDGCGEGSAAVLEAALRLSVLLVPRSGSAALPSKRLLVPRSSSAAVLEAALRLSTLLVPRSGSWCLEAAPCASKRLPSKRLCPRNSSLCLEEALRLVRERSGGKVEARGSGLGRKGRSRRRREGRRNELGDVVIREQTRENDDECGAGEGIGLRELIHADD